MNSLGLSIGELNLIRDVFLKNSAIVKAVVFGSRVKGNYKKYSDIDIALFDDGSHLNVERILHELDELPLIYKFDVVAYGAVKNLALREHIDRVGVTVFERAPAFGPNRAEVQ